MPDKHKIILLSDHPLVPSGVGTQSKYLIEGLLKTGKYRFLCLGGAIEHPDYRPQKVAPEKFGDDWLVLPVKGYGDKNVIRQILDYESPSAFFLFTDPRFFIWVWEMEDEIRSICPIIYWHVWDNDPTPKFNKNFYESNDFISPLSLKTYGILQDMDYPADRYRYIPHAVDREVFKPLPEAEVLEFKKKNFGPHADSKFILFWNNRNARRKVTGDVIACFAQFARVVGKENVSLMMHTQVHDPEGQDVLSVAKCYGIEQRLIVSEARIPPEELNRFYNVADCTINIANNEGFGLSTLESIFSGTPVIVQMTGGLQYQIGNWWDGLKDFRNQEELTRLAKTRWQQGKGKWWGIPIFPATRSCTGSQQIPYIYDDRVAHEDVVKALLKMYELGREGRRQIGKEGREWAMPRFNLEQMVSAWDEVFTSTIEKFAARDRGPRSVAI